jgi:hypothetical protein
LQLLQLLAEHYRIQIEDTAGASVDDEGSLDERMSIGQSFVEALRAELLLTDERAQWRSRLDDVCYGGALMHPQSMGVSVGKMLPLGGGDAGKSLEYFGHGVGNGAWELMGDIAIHSLVRVGLRLDALREDVQSAITAYAAQPLTLRMMEQVQLAQRRLAGANNSTNACLGSSMLPLVGEGEAGGLQPDCTSRIVDERCDTHEGWEGGVLKNLALKVPESMQRHYHHFGHDQNPSEEDMLPPNPLTRRRSYSGGVYNMQAPTAEFSDQIVSTPRSESQIHEVPYHTAVVDALRRTRQMWADADRGWSDGVQEGVNERDVVVAAAVAATTARCLTGSSDLVHLTVKVYPDPHRHCLRIRCCLINLSNIDIEGLRCELGCQGPVRFADHTTHQYAHTVPGRLRPRAVTEWDLDLEVLRFGRIRVMLELVFQDVEQDEEDACEEEAPGGGGGGDRGGGGPVEDVILPVEDYLIPLNVLLVRPPPHRLSIACFRAQWANTSHALYANTVSSVGVSSSGSGTGEIVGSVAMLTALEARCKQPAVGLGWVGSLQPGGHNTVSTSSFSTAIMSQTWEGESIGILLTGVFSAAAAAAAASVGLAACSSHGEWSVRVEVRCATRAVAEAMHAVFEVGC